MNQRPMKKLQSAVDAYLCILRQANSAEIHSLLNASRKTPVKYLSLPQQ